MCCFGSSCCHHSAGASTFAQTGIIVCRFTRREAWLEAYVIARLVEQHNQLRVCATCNWRGMRSTARAFRHACYKTGLSTEQVQVV